MKIYICGHYYGDECDIDAVFLDRQHAELYTSVHTEDSIEEMDTSDEVFTVDKIRYIYRVSYCREKDELDYVDITPFFVNDDRHHEPKPFFRDNDKYCFGNWCENRKLDENEVENIFFEKLESYKKETEINK